LATPIDSSTPVSRVSPMDPRPTVPLPTNASAIEASHATGDRSPLPRRLLGIALVIVVLGLAVRFGWPHSISFAGEQIDSIALAWKSWNQGPPPHGLRASVGIDMPPLFVWLVMIPVWFTRDPVLVTACFALANLGALILLGVTLRRAFGAQLAWMTVILLAAAPWPVLFSRKIWAPDLSLPFQVLFLWALVRWLEQRTRGRLVLVVVVLAASFQIHPALWFTGPAAVVWMLAYRVRVPWRDLAIGVLLALVPYAPWIHYQFASGFDGFGVAFTHTVGERAVPEAVLWSRSLVDVLAMPFQLAGGTRLDLAIGSKAHGLWAESSTTTALLYLQRGICVLTGIGFVAALVHSLRRAAWRPRSAPTSTATLVLGLCAIQVVAVIAQLLLVKRGAVPHYLFVLVLPATIAFAWGIDHAARKLFASRPTAGVVFASVIALIHAATTVSFLEFIRTRPDAIFRIYDPPYAAVRENLHLALDRAIDEALHGRERRREITAALQPRFESATEVLVRLDPADPARTAGELRDLELGGSESGTAWRTVGRSPWWKLRPFEIPPDRAVLLRIDLTVPADSLFQVCYQTAAQPMWTRRQTISIPLVAGRTQEVVLLDAPDLLPEIGMRLAVYRATIHALELRAVEQGTGAR